MQKLGGSPFKVSLGKQFSEILFQKHPTQKRIDRVAKALSSNPSTTKKKKKKKLTSMSRAWYTPAIPASPEKLRLSILSSRPTWASPVPKKVKS
jgi:hypothetical protein